MMKSMKKAVIAALVLGSLSVAGSALAQEKRPTVFSPKPRPAAEVSKNLPPKPTDAPKDRKDLKRPEPPKGTGAPQPPKDGKKPPERPKDGTRPTGAPRPPKDGARPTGIPQDKR